MSMPSASRGRLTVCPILGNRPQGERYLRSRRPARREQILRLPRLSQIQQSLPTLFTPMLKNIQPRPLFYFAGKYLICGLALVGLTTVRSVVADEPTNKLVHVVTRQEGEMTRFFVQNLEPTEVTATF